MPQVDHKLHGVYAGSDCVCFMQKPVALKPFQATSNAIVVRPTGQVSVWEEQVPQKLYMDYSGHCHAKLDDGGYLFMDQFGHCHKKLDDGGYLYMDNIGHCHKRLDDEVPQNSAPRASANHIHHPKPRSANKQRSLVAMLGDLTTADKSRDEQAAHDGELRQLQAKPVAMLGCNQQRVKINKATRQSHHISQPRRFN